jgi:hypothetical protein
MIQSPDRVSGLFYVPGQPGNTYPNTYQIIFYVCMVRPCGPLCL